jgi:hypothetical protein
MTDNQTDDERQDGENHGLVLLEKGLGFDLDRLGLGLGGGNRRINGHGESPGCERILAFTYIATFPRGIFEERAQAVDYRLKIKFKRDFRSRSPILDTV